MRAHYVSIAECHRVRGTAVVIDVLRAFSTAAWAFHLGVDRIVLSDDIEEALRIKAKLPGALAMKDSQPLAGFELSNSPVELQSAGRLAGATIVQRILMSLDLTVLWATVLQILGYQYFTQKSIVTATIVVLGPLALIVGISALAALL